MRGRILGKAQLEASLALCAAVLLTAACSGDDIGAAQYASDQCRRVALIDEASASPIRGAEDIVLDTAGARVFISAYDRRATEKAARRKAAMDVQGGVYAVDLEALFNPKTDEISVRSLAAPESFAGGLRPHGIAYDATNKELVFINRTYEREGRKWQMTPRLQRIGANGEMFVGEPGPAHCAANDVVADASGVFTTFDHSGCGWTAGIEDVLALKRSGIVSDGDEGAPPVFKGVAFANGLARTVSGDLVMAATRERALVIVGKTSNGVTERARIKVPGGPDNLSIGHDGDIIAAVHPAMLRLALNRKFGIGRAPSRLVSVDADTGRVDILFDDPKGAMFSAATVGVETPAGLIAGSVTDTGLMICEARL